MTPTAVPTTQAMGEAPSPSPSDPVEVVVAAVVAAFRK